MDYFPVDSLVRDDLVHWSFGFVVWIHIGSEQVADCIEFQEYIQSDVVLAEIFDRFVYAEVADRLVSAEAADKLVSAEAADRFVSAEAADRFVSAEVADNPVLVGVVGNIDLVVGIVNSEHC